MTRLGRSTAVLIATLAGALAAAGPLGADRGGARGDVPQPTYRGHLVGDPTASVLLRPHNSHGNRRRGRFEAQNVPLLCDDGSTVRVEHRTGFVRFANNGTFANIYSWGISRGHESFFRLQGSLRSRDRAAGTIFVYHDPLDPPTEPDASECSTSKPLRWKATRNPR
jgi:hypothetical protein